MRLRDTGLGFGLVTIVMHWIGAVMVLGFTLASTAVRLVPADAVGQATVAALVWTGVFASAISLFRLLWRVLHYYPLPLTAKSPLVIIVQRSLAFALLLGGIVLPWLFFALMPDGQADLPRALPVNALGFLPRWGLLSLYWLGSVLILATALVHAGAAIAGAFAGRDPSLARMAGRSIAP